MKLPAPHSLLSWLVVLALGSLFCPAQHITNGLLVRAEGRAEIYLCMDDSLHHIPDPETFDRLFHSGAHVSLMQDSILHLTSTGDPLAGAYLAKGSGDEVYLIYHETRRHITSMEVFNRFRFEISKIRIMEEDDLLKIPAGKPLLRVKPLEFPLPCGVKDGFPPVPEKGALRKPD
jgi:hypothetical protein